MGNSSDDTRAEAPSKPVQRRRAQSKRVRWWSAWRAPSPVCPTPAIGDSLGKSMRIDGPGGIEGMRNHELEFRVLLVGAFAEGITSSEGQSIRVPVVREDVRDDVLR